MWLELDQISNQSWTRFSWSKIWSALVQRGLRVLLKHWNNVNWIPFPVPRMTHISLRVNCSEVMQVSYHRNLEAHSCSLVINLPKDRQDDAWMDGLMDKKMDGWTNGWMDRWTEWVSRVEHPAWHKTGHFWEESFQAITCNWYWQLNSKQTRKNTSKNTQRSNKNKLILGKKKHANTQITRY